MIQRTLVLTEDVGSLNNGQMTFDGEFISIGPGYSGKIHAGTTAVMMPLVKKTQ